MQEIYDKAKTAALIKQAQDITCLLKAETKSLTRQMGRVLEGGEEDPDDVLEGDGVTSSPNAGPVGKSLWQFWR